MPDTMSASKPTSGLSRWLQAFARAPGGWADPAGTRDRLLLLAWQFSASRIETSLGLFPVRYRSGSSLRRWAGNM